jgi:hypothetical protein
MKVYTIKDQAGEELCKRTLEQRQISIGGEINAGSFWCRIVAVDSPVIYIEPLYAMQEYGKHKAGEQYLPQILTRGKRS